MTTNYAGNRSIQLSAVDDDIVNEGDERFILNYVHDIGPVAVDVIENGGEFLRDTATVIIKDCK